MAGVELCSASCCSCGKGEREREGRKEKGKKKKEKKRKGRRKREERERGFGTIRGGGRPRACCGVQPIDDVHAEREEAEPRRGR